MSEKKPFVRLPTKVVPRNYALELQPDLQKFTFSGKLDITVEVINATLFLLLLVCLGKHSYKDCCFELC